MALIGFVFAALDGCARQRGRDDGVPVATPSLAEGFQGVRRQPHGPSAASGGGIGWSRQKRPIEHLHNSAMYDKQGSVLRVETVINNPRDMKVYRTKEGDEDGEKNWQRLRKGARTSYSSWVSW